MSTNVYVIAQPDGIRKVGVASDPNHRLSQLQTANPRTLTLERSIAHANARKIEATVHKILSPCRTTREWFDCDLPQIDNAIEMAEIVIRRVEDKESQVKNSDADDFLGTPLIFKERLRELFLNAREKRITQKEIAKKLGIGHEALNKWLTWHTEPSLTNIMKIASYFDVDINWLLGRDGADKKWGDKSRLARVEAKLDRALSAQASCHQ